MGISVWSACTSIPVLKVMQKYSGIVAIWKPLMWCEFICQFLDFMFFPTPGFEHKYRKCPLSMCVLTDHHCRALSAPKYSRIEEQGTHRVQIICAPYATMVPVEAEGILTCIPAKGSEWQGKGEVECRRKCWKLSRVCTCPVR